MINCPPLSLAVRYDIKGCMAGRFQAPRAPGSSLPVYKDQNFRRERLCLGQDSRWFLAQVARDADFLRRHGVVDYSLLVGVQRQFKSPSSDKKAEETAPQQEQTLAHSAHKLDLAERKALWDSLVRLVEDGEGEQLGREDSLLLERLRCGSRLSNISAFVELLGDGASQNNSPAKNGMERNGSSMSEDSRTKSVTILKKFLTPGWRNLTGASTPPASTPTDSFQVSSTMSSMNANNDAMLSDIVRERSSGRI